MTSTNNEVILEKLNNIHKDVQAVNVRLDRLNSKVAEHEGHANRQKVINQMLSYVAGALVVAIVGIIIKFVFLGAPVKAVSP